MAQDFGDDIGELLLRTSERLIEEQIRRHLQSAGLNIKTESEAMWSPDTICVPFGDAQDAAYFAQVCRNEGVPVIPFEDKTGTGYIQFASNDIQRVKDSVPQFAQTMTRLREQRIAQTLSAAEPIGPERLSELSEITQLPDLPSDRPEHTARQVEQEVPQHTQEIADKVRDARERCADFQEFKDTLARQRVGITTGMSGEYLFYEARTRADGTLLPFEHRKDWSVGAGVLHDKYGVDARMDSFDRTRTLGSDGSLDQRGETPDPRQGIASHDGMDTDTRTVRIEREQNGTDVPPSTAREGDARAYSLDSVARDMRSASKQLQKESGIDDRTADISDKLNPVR